MTLKTEGQVASWYHGKILRIPHGKQNPKKRYLTEGQILELFTGEVEIQEKVDGKLDCHLMSFDTPHQKEYWIKEVLHPKNSVHAHIKYDGWNVGGTHHNAPKTVWLDTVFIGFDGIPIFKPMLLGSPLKYGTVMTDNPTIEQIYTLLGAFAKLKSHYGSSQIEGVVCKNYEKQLMGKWINDEFEDRLDS